MGALFGRDFPAGFFAVIRHLAQLPAAIRRRFFPPKIPLERLAGLEASGGQPLTVLCGMGAQEKSYISDLAFSSQPSVSSDGQIRLPTIFRRAVPQQAGCSIIALGSMTYRLSSFRRTDGWFIIPVWVRGDIKLPLPAATLRAETVKRDLRNIRHHGFDYRVTQDPAHFDEFYHHMHAPYILKAHGGAAHLQPYEEAKQKPGSYDLLLIHKKSQPELTIAGIVILYEPAGPRLLQLGVRQGGPDYVREGVTAAMYHFSFQHLAAKGFSHVRTGGSRPFLRDGVLRFKRKMSQTLIEPSWNSMALKILSFTPATRAFLINNPFIHEGGGALHGAVFVESPLTAEIIAEIDHRYFSPGLAKITVYTFLPDETLRATALPPELATRVEIRSAHELLETGPACA